MTILQDQFTNFLDDFIRSGSRLSPSTKLVFKWQVTIPKNVITCVCSWLQPCKLFDVRQLFRLPIESIVLRKHAVPSVQPSQKSTNRGEALKTKDAQRSSMTSVNDDGWQIDAWGLHQIVSGNGSLNCGERAFPVTFHYPPRNYQSWEIKILKSIKVKADYKFKP